MSSKPDDSMPPKRALTQRNRTGVSPVARPRLDDVARLAGVSTATVSRVLNKQEIVTPRLQQAVMNAVEELGYVPHGAARALAPTTCWHAWKARRLRTRPSWTPRS